MNKSIEYKLTPTAMKFHADPSRVRAVMSPVGSGKSVMMFMELLRLIMTQPASDDGVRYSRSLVVRNTYSELKTTVLNTVKDWLDTEQFPIRMGSPMSCTVEIPLDDGTRTHGEILFQALDHESNASKLQSLELTFLWISEAAEVDPNIIKVALTRLGRYPRKAICPSYRSCAIMEYNPPTVGSYLYKIFEVDRPRGWRLFRQPAALIREINPDDPKEHTYKPNPVAENVENQSKGYDYYLDMVDDFKGDFNKIERFVMGNYVMSLSGGGIYAGVFSEVLHVRPSLPQSFQRELLVATDIGNTLHPAALVAQEHNGQLFIMGEVIGTDVSVTEFEGDQLSPTLNETYKRQPPLLILDPAAVGRSDIDKRSAYQLMREVGRVKLAPTNNTRIRIERVTRALKRTGYINIDPSCTQLIAALAGGYHWRKRNEGSLQDNKPAKNHPASDVADALAYLICYLDKSGVSDPPLHTDTQHFKHPQGGITTVQDSFNNAKRTPSGRFLFV